MKKKVKAIPFHFKSVQGDDGCVKYFGIASSDALDRDREILVPKGMNTDNFQKNPVMLLGHNYYGLPIGKILSTEIKDAGVEFEFEFADTDEAQTVKSLYDGGFMHAFSVSFIPKKYIDIEDDAPEKMDITLADGSIFELDFSKYTAKPRGVISDWELLEISAVSIPANPEAVIQRSFDLAMGSIDDPARKNLFKSQNEDAVTDMIAQVKSLISTFDDLEIKGAIPIHQTPITDSDFDRDTAKINLAVFASADNSGTKDTLDWGLYSRGFGWLDEAKMGMLSGYKYCHHDIEDGKLVANWKGLQASMKKLLGDIEQDDREEIYKHLAQHFVDYDQVAPELKEYTVDELENFPMVGIDPGAPEGDKSVSFVSSEGLLEAIKSLLDGRFEEIEETLICRLGVLAGMFEESMLFSGKLVEGGDLLDSSSGDEGDLGSKYMDEVTNIFEKMGG